MTIIDHLHRILRWAILLVLLLAIIKAFMGMQSKAAFTRSDDKNSLMLTVLADVQLLLGLVLYFVGPMGMKNIQNMGMAEVMKNGYARFFAMEHIVMMLAAIVLIHIGRAKAKKAVTDLSKHKISFWFYFIALILILAAIPWPFRQGFEGLGWM
jgi:hypothetical protein